MEIGKADKAAILASLPMRPDEDPFVVAIGGFYRRWFNLLDDLQPLLDTVAKLKGTEDEDWVPAWNAVAAPFEKEAEAALARGDRAAARRAFLEAKTYYSLARFPAPYHSGSAICPPQMSAVKRQAYEKYLECFRKASSLLDRPPEVVRVTRDGREAVGYAWGSLINDPTFAPSNPYQLVFTFPYPQLFNAVIPPGGSFSFTFGTLKPLSSPVAPGQYSSTFYLGYTLCCQFSSPLNVTVERPLSSPQPSQSTDDASKALAAANWYRAFLQR